MSSDSSSSSSSSPSSEPPATSQSLSRSPPSPSPPSTSSSTATTTSSSSFPKIQASIQSLFSILPSVPSSLLSSPNPALSLLHDPDTSSQISTLLRHPDSGSGDNNLCRWFYDTFQSSDPHLQLVVLRFLPIIAGLYLSRVVLRKPLAGFEAVLLAFYAHETTSRGGQPITVNIPDLSNPSIYHEAKSAQPKNNSSELNLAVISASLEPHGTVRSTKRARIVGIALELYYSKISQMPIRSKFDFCEFCQVWSGQDGDMYKEGADSNGGEGNEQGNQVQEVMKKKKKEGRIPLPWELLQPVLRILGHCILGPQRDMELYEAACAACRSLHARSLHDINPKAILATGSLLRLIKMDVDPKNDIDHTEIRMTNLITI